ncbi:hypothetical protein BD324DRAFT_618999 [Kockovaella imperatae]|uniref:DUF1754-domain-containing protein n=1 Tax=Kockovaella imperatae TaxID=4999 RepID=A0A1Y1UMH6_9TREE|nr:hypothetical protein BD324DRAFT_618999 [Kockovaella imperatae]ORX39250.1 hypothetical protein BD324DRAFT_618999 [Kockovaella imperatae]
MSDYAHRPGGKLKLKGEGEKKKKKKSHSSSDRAKVDAEISQKEKERERETQEVEERPTGRKMTDAERRFEEIQRKRREERALKNAKMSHKDRVQEFNQRLDSLSEHHDMPRIGPG